ncbi:RAD51-associated protein 2, partial [Galemys pyrenaicus]
VMSLTHLTPQDTEFAELAPPFPPLEDPDSQPPRPKRLRLEEPDVVSEAEWELPFVPRLSEVEKVWEFSPRPFKAFLFSPQANFENATHACVEKPVSGQQIRNVKSQESKFQGERSQPLASQSSDSGWSSSRRSDREVFRALCRNGSGAEASQRLPNASSHDLHGTKHDDGKQGLVQGRDNQENNSYVKQADKLFSVTFCKEKESATHEIKSRCKAGSVMPSNKKENNISASMLKISKSQNQPSVVITKPSYFRESRTISIREFPTDLNSKMSSAYLKEIAKEKNDTYEAYVRDFTNIYWFQNRLDVKKQKLRDDKKTVGEENIFPERYESFPQSLCNQNICVKKKDSINLNCYNHNRIKSDIRDSEKDFTIILENANLEEAEASLDSYISNTRLEKSQSWDCSTAHVLRKNRENCWIVSNYKMKCENMKKTGAKLSLLQLLEIDLLSNTITVNTHEEQLESLMIGTLGSLKTLVSFFWLNDKGETYQMQWLIYCTTQKDLHLSNFESLIEGIYYFPKCISGSQKDILNWYEILIYKEQTDVQNITGSIAINRKNNILSIYLQSKVSEPLNILTTNIVSLFSNVDSLARIENGSRLEEGYIFKWIVSYPKNAVESHNILRMFSRLSEDNMKPILEKGQLKNEQVFEESRGNINSFCMTTKNIQFPNFETYEKISLSMDFDNMGEILLTKETSYKNKCCPEQHMNEENLTVKTLVKSSPPFIWINHENINATSYEISNCNQDLDTERKPEHNGLSSFNFKDILEDFINIRQQAIQSSHHRRHSKQTNPTSIIQVPNFGKLLTEIKGKNNNLILKEKVKATAQSLANSCHAYKDIEIEKEKKNSFDSKDDIFSVQLVLLMNKKANMEETKNVYQNNVADRNEYERILQEIELANLEHFYPKNDSTESVNYQLETYLSLTNNECFQDLTAKCLPTETLTIVKDFEMKSKFDLVLEELRMFHEISKENEILSTVETNNGLENYFEENNVGEVKMEIKKDLNVSTGNKICASSLYCDTKTCHNMHKRHQNVFKWKTVPKSGEQEVPKEYYCSRTSEELLYSEKECEKTSPKRPASFSDEFDEEKFNYLLKGDRHNQIWISRKPRNQRGGLLLRQKLKSNNRLQGLLCGSRSSSRGEALQQPEAHGLFREPILLDP